MPIPQLGPPPLVGCVQQLTVFPPHKGLQDIFVDLRAYLCNKLLSGVRMQGDFWECLKRMLQSGMCCIYLFSYPAYLEAV
jgi:hypothetical protein